MATNEIGRNIAEVRSRIVRACERSRKSPDSVKLIAVSKKVTSDRIMSAAESGIKDFGESYVQEACVKISQPPLSEIKLNWHFIGHLQRNKVREVVGRFDTIHSVDSLALADEISRRSISQNLKTQILLEIRLDMAVPKFGFLPDELQEVVVKVNMMPGITLRGLMGMPPFSDSSEDSRPHFRRLKSLFDLLPDINRFVLSMGMSGDFEVAIEEGATQVRVGTAIFGHR